ncbi:uncharacterized protein LOC135138722 [Zophobas morio]|uniref:uncharacterized protein LOC135138722 n=1 Tax=Zophobas morio TaxID=2755281 RepID=UPI003082B540
MNNVPLCVVTLVSLCNCLQFPSSFKKCDKRRNDFNECLSDVVYDSLKVLDKPLPGFPSLRCIEFPPDAMMEIGNRTYGLWQKYTKFRVTGLSNPQSIKTRLDFGPVTSTLTIEASYSELTWESELEAQGTVVLLPLNVITPGELIMYNPTLSFTIKLEEYEKGATYFRVIDSEFDMKSADRLKIEFKQLFPNRRLNDEFNSALSEKGLQTFELFKHLQVAFAPHFGSVFNNFLEKVPVVELFDE